MHKDLDRALLWFRRDLRCDEAVYTNHDDDPAAPTRDARVRGALADTGVALHTGKDHVIFERDEVRTLGGTPRLAVAARRSAKAHAAALCGGEIGR